MESLFARHEHIVSIPAELFGAGDGGDGMCSSSCLGQALLLGKRALAPTLCNNTIESLSLTFGHQELGILRAE